MTRRRKYRKQNTFSNFPYFSKPFVKKAGRFLRWALVLALTYLAATTLVSLLPRKPQEKEVPLPAKPKITFVIDDIGHKIQDQNLIESLGSDVTYAILPMLRYSRHFSDLGRLRGAEIILHLPLEAADNTVPGPGLITSRMETEHALDILDRNLRSVPGHRGANNHMGSQGTSNPQIMRLILTELKKRDLFFLDSMTTSKTVSSLLGQQIGVPVLHRDIFLDNEDEEPAIRRQIDKLKLRALERGYAIGIGHYRYRTLTVLNEEIPRLKREGFVTVPLSKMTSFKQSL